MSIARVRATVLCRKPGLQKNILGVNLLALYQFECARPLGAVAWGVQYVTAAMQFAVILSKSQAK